jgi:hypothetical protein
MTKPEHHHEHPSHAYERLEKTEEWVGRIAIVVAFVVGAVVVFGLLTATGHVTW